MILLCRLLTTQGHSPLTLALYYYEAITCPLMLHQVVQSSPKLLAFKLLITLHVHLAEPAVPQMKRSLITEQLCSQFLSFGVRL